MIRNSHNRPTA